MDSAWIVKAYKRITYIPLSGSLSGTHLQESFLCPSYCAASWHYTLHGCYQDGRSSTSSAGSADGIEHNRRWINMSLKQLEYVHLKYAKILKLYQIILNDLKLIYNTMSLSVVNMLSTCYSLPSHEVWRSFTCIAVLEAIGAIAKQHRVWVRVGITDVGMDQYLYIPFLGGWTSIYQLFWCSPGVQGFDTLPCTQRKARLFQFLSAFCCLASFLFRCHSVDDNYFWPLLGL